MSDSVSTQDVPFFSIEEEVVHFITHFFGVLFMIMLGNYLWTKQGISTGLNIALWIYLITFISVFLVSSIYHSQIFNDQRRQWKKLDHISIYFFIAGSNTPYLIEYSTSELGILFLVLMWLLVAVGAYIKWQEVEIPDLYSLVFYLFMGWLGVVTVYLIYPNLEKYTFVLILIGGILYTIGTYFYHRDYKKWHHSIWHLFVLCAAMTHFGALYIQVHGNATV